MKNNAYLFILTLPLLLGSCNDEFSGPPIIESYDLPPFSNIELQTSSGISIYQSNYFQVIVDGYESDVHDTEVFVDQGWLVIREHGSIHPDQHITIHTPSIVELDCYGSSYVYGETLFEQTEPMNIHGFGSGDVDMYIDTDIVNIKNSGSGNIIVSGQAAITDLDLTGSGWIRSFLLPAEISNVFLSGSGSAEVNVDVDLDILLTGSGDVYYKGHPSLDVQINGSGHVFDAN